MSFIKKIWKNRQSQYPLRRILTDITNNTTQTVTVTRAEGSVTEQGDAFNAENMNDLENRIAAEFADQRDAIEYLTGFADEAEESAENSEAWAVGKRKGVDVPSTDETYQNNSKYYAGQAKTSAQNAQASAQSASSSMTSAAGSATLAGQKATAAEQSATAAAQSASAAASSAQTATTKAGEATTAASTATSKASEATTAASTATSKATEATSAAGTATTAAQTATTRAGEANTAATNAEASAVRAEQAAQSTEGVVKWSEAEGYVGKNLLENNLTDASGSGLTFTKNANGSVTVNGTATANTGRTVDSAVNIGAGAYILSQGVISPHDCRLTATITENGATRYVDLNGVTEKAFSIADGATVLVSINVSNGVSANDITLYPMLRYASITDDTYEPYLPNNREIAEKAFSDVSWEEQGVLGAKNLLQLKNTTQTINGVTFTVNDDKSITVNGTATANASYSIVPWTEKFKFDAGTYTASDGGASTDDCYFYANGYEEDGTPHYNEFRLPIKATFTMTWAYYVIGIFVPSGRTVDNVTFYPMIRLASINDATFAPYAMTNRELTEKVKAGSVDIQNDFIESLPEGVTIAAESAAYVKCGICFVNLLLNKQDGFVKNADHKIFINRKYLPIQTTNTNQAASFASSQWGGRIEEGYMFLAWYGATQGNNAATCRINEAADDTISYRWLKINIAYPISDAS